MQPHANLTPPFAHLPYPVSATALVAQSLLFAFALGWALDEKGRREAVHKMRRSLGVESWRRRFAAAARGRNAPLSSSNAQPPAERALDGFRWLASKASPTAESVG